MGVLKGTQFTIEYQWTAASPFTDDAGANINVSILGRNQSVIDGPYTAADLFTAPSSGIMAYTGTCYGITMEHTDAGNVGPDHFSILRVDVTIPGLTIEPGPTGTRFDPGRYLYYWPDDGTTLPAYQAVPANYPPYTFDATTYWTQLAQARFGTGTATDRYITGAAVTMSAAWQAANPTRPATQPCGPITIMWLAARGNVPRAIGTSYHLRQRQTPYIT